MNPRLMHVGRAGGTAVIAASALMALASTSQTPHGFVNANFGAPLSIFGIPTTSELQPDVLAIGDGSADAAELAELLQTAGSPTEASVAFQASEGTSAPTAPQVVVLPAPADMGSPVPSATTSKQALNPVPVVDAGGRVDCSGSVSCKTDPKTNTTTVTYSDGTVALVQQVNDMTLIAYQKVKDNVQDVVEALLPGVSSPLPAAAIQAAPPSAAAAEPSSAAPAVPAVPAEPAPAQTPSAQAPVRAIDPGPPAPEVTTPDISASTVRPRVTVSTPPEDFSPGSAGSPGKGPKPVPPAIRENLDKVAEAVGSAVNKIGEAVGKALNPGAAVKPPTKPANDARDSDDAE